MKVLFLDHDGVICLPKQYGSRQKKIMLYDSHTDPWEYNPANYPIDVRTDDFDKDAIKILNEIIEETDCEIVISSDWREDATLEEIQLLYKHWGIIKQPIAFTPIFDPDWDIPVKIYFEDNEKYEKIRYFEISKYLEEHPEIKHYLVVDDLLLSRKVYTWANKKEPIDRGWGFENFIHAKWNEGLKQTNLKNKIIKHLNKMKEKFYAIDTDGEVHEADTPEELINRISGHLLDEVIFIKGVLLKPTLALDE